MRNRRTIIFIGFILVLIYLLSHIEEFLIYFGRWKLYSEVKNEFKNEFKTNLNFCWMDFPFNYITLLLFGSISKKMGKWFNTMSTKNSLPKKSWVYGIKMKISFAKNKLA